jgi:hypothetical protein
MAGKLGGAEGRLLIAQRQKRPFVHIFPSRQLPTTLQTLLGHRKFTRLCVTMFLQRLPHTRKGQILWNEGMKLRLAQLGFARCWLVGYIVQKIAGMMG